MAQVVVDASVVVKWVLEEPYTGEALTLLDRWADDGTRFVSPDLLWYEVSNILYKRVRRGAMSVETVLLHLGRLMQIGPEVVSASPIHGLALSMTNQLGLPATYDAHYLALASALGCECWTADERLWNSVQPKLPWVRWIGEVDPAPAASHEG